MKPSAESSTESLTVSWLLHLIISLLFQLKNIVALHWRIVEPFLEVIFLNREFDTMDDKDFLDAYDEWRQDELTDKFTNNKK